MKVTAREVLCFCLGGKSMQEGICVIHSRSKSPQVPRWFTQFCLWHEREDHPGPVGRLNPGMEVKDHVGSRPDFIQDSLNNS
jgi:hypothetical protein